MTQGRFLVASIICMVAIGSAQAALQDCTTSDPLIFENEGLCACPFEKRPLPGGGTVACEYPQGPSFKCIPPASCVPNEIDLPSGGCVTGCDEIRGCNESCCNNVNPTCTEPGCDSVTCASDPSECELCVPEDIINPCTLAATYEGSSPTVQCPGSAGPEALPLVGQPSRDPFSFGIFALIQVKAEDVRFHRDVNGDNNDDPLGPACHIGTNCNTTNTSSPFGTINLNAAVFPAGSQIVTGKVRWRAKDNQDPALAAEVFSNDAVFPGGNKACTVNDGRQLWCPIPLLRNRYDQCPVGGDQNDCTDDPDGAEFCFCEDPCHVEAHFDETIGTPNAVANFEGLVNTACNGGCPPVTATASPVPQLLAPGCYSTVTVKKGATLSLKDGLFPYVICHVKMEGGSSSTRAKVVTDSSWAGGPIALFVDRLTVGSWGEFLWQEPFWWDPDDSNAPLAPSEVMVVAYTSTDDGISLSQDSKAHGTLMAPRSDVNLGTRSSIRGRIVAGKKAVGAPDNIYCGCRGNGAECDTGNDCCSLTCTNGLCTEPS